MIGATSRHRSPEVAWVVGCELYERMHKHRLTVTVDPELVRAGTLAVRRGEARSISEWANAALAARAREDERARALARALEAYETENGAFSDAELSEIAERDAARGIHVGPTATPRKARSSRRRAARRAV